MFSTAPTAQRAVTVTMLVGRAPRRTVASGSLATLGQADLGGARACAAVQADWCGAAGAARIGSRSGPALATMLVVGCTGTAKDAPCGAQYGQCSKAVCCESGAGVRPDGPQMSDVGLASPDASAIHAVPRCPARACEIDGAKELTRIATTAIHATHRRELFDFIRTRLSPHCVGGKEGLAPNDRSNSLLLWIRGSITFCSRSLVQTGSGSPQPLSTKRPVRSMTKLTGMRHTRP